MGTLYTLNILKTGSNVFITGSAGTGKTYLLHQYIFYLKSRQIIPTVVAPTGIAASHLNGRTIHSYFSLGIREIVSDEKLDLLLKSKQLLARLSQLKVLIIDEISMVSPELFTTMDKILRKFKKNDLAFGGIQTIISGDFFQLPPISKFPKEKHFAWQSSSWRELALKSCYLQKKFRQDDNVLITILDEIRSANITQHTYDVLHSRYLKELDIDFKPTRLYTHNLDVDKINDDELKKIDKKPYHFKYQAEGNPKDIERIFKSSLVLEEITLKQDAVVMFIKNNYDLGYINGTTGIVVGFHKTSKLPIVKIASGELIETILEDWSIEDENGNITASIKQVPLKLAWAITIHKSQGMTLDAAEIDLSKTFEVGQGYVALSRIRSIEGLRLMGFNDTSLTVDPLILHIDDRIKAASDKANMEISSLSNKHLEEIFDRYIESIGGVTDKKAIEKEIGLLQSQKSVIVKSTLPTHLQTKELIESVESIEELATRRGISKGTVINHLEKIKDQESDINLDKFLPNESILSLVEEAVRLIKEKNNKDDFTESGKLRLKPIYELLDAKIEYDTIRLALLKR